MSHISHIPGDPAEGHISHIPGDPIVSTPPSQAAWQRFGTWPHPKHTYMLTGKEKEMNKE